MKRDTEKKTAAALLYDYTTNRKYIVQTKRKYLMNAKTMFSSVSTNWETPQAFFDDLNAEFHFTLDPCADAENHKCETYFTKAENGLARDWGGHIVFCNPPYGKEINKWVEKCYREGHKDKTIVVLLLPARTDTAYFHDFILHRSEIRFIRGRLKFGDGKNSAPFPSMLVIFRGAGM